MTALPDHVGDHPMFLPLLETFDGQRRYFCPSETAPQQNGDHSVVTFPAQTALIKDGKEALALGGG